jgi:hypothetical protein
MITNDSSRKITSPESYAEANQVYPTQAHQIATNTRQK